MSGRVRLKHQTDSLQRTRRMSLFVASSSLPNPNSISIPVFMLNVFSLTVTNYILIHEMHFTEEAVWLVRVWHKWEMMKAVVCFCFSSVMLVEISCDTGISLVALSNLSFFLSFFNISSLTSWKTNLWISICCRSLSTSRQLCFHA